MILRPLQPSDKENRRRHGTHRSIVRNYGTNAGDHKWDQLEADRWYSEARDRQHSAYWMIEHNGQLVGEAHLNLYNQAEGRARYSIGLFTPAVQGLGIGTEVTRLVLAHYFDALNLHRVDARSLAFNTAVIAMNTNCGFVMEGRERETCFIDGEWQDDLIMSILEQEYRSASALWV